MKALIGCRAGRNADGSFRKASPIYGEVDDGGTGCSLPPETIKELARILYPTFLAEHNTENEGSKTA